MTALSPWAEGTNLPAETIEISAALIVSGALASQDFEPVHHDVQAAKAAGTPDIFMNILTTSGLVSSYLTRWAGPDSSLRNLQLKLGAPNFPGDTLVLTGQVSEVLADGQYQVAFRGKNGLGNHVTGSAVVFIDNGSRRLKSDG